MIPTFAPLGRVCPRVLILLLLSHSHAEAQPGERDVRPAAAHVSRDPTAAGAELFSYEAIQLTDSVLVDLKNRTASAQYAPLFAFGSQEPPGAGAGDCKTYPGDPLWPSADLWAVYNDLLGNALSPIVPIASPCYVDSAYDNYDASRCASVAEGWGEGSTQLVAIRTCPRVDFANSSPT